jgi:hypothetical protein
MTHIYLRVIGMLLDILGFTFKHAAEETIDEQIFPPYVSLYRYMSAHLDPLTVDAVENLF